MVGIHEIRHNPSATVFENYFDLLSRRRWEFGRGLPVRDAISGESAIVIVINELSGNDVEVATPDLHAAVNAEIDRKVVEVRQPLRARNPPLACSVVLGDDGTDEILVSISDKVAAIDLE